MPRQFANEADLHQEVIEQIGTFPTAYLGSPGARALVWAHELKLHDAGRRGGDGSADLLTVDTAGMVWLIEVKFNYSNESGVRVWHDQLTRYRTALMTMKWEKLVTYAQGFLLGTRKARPHYLSGSSVLTLEDYLSDWLQAAGTHSVSSADIVASMSERLRTGNFGIMLVSNYFSVADKAEAETFANAVHRGPVAYAVVNTDNQGLAWTEHFYRGASREFSAPTARVSSRLRSDKAPVMTPAHLRAVVSPECRDLLDSVVFPRLEKMGWTYKYSVRRDAFQAKVFVGGQLVPLLVVGTSERDAMAVSRQAKVQGGYSLKINPRIKAVLEYTGNSDFVNRYLKRFYALGWRGRRRNDNHLRWGVIDVSADEIMASEGALIYYPTLALRDHVGREGDLDNLSAFFDIFEEMVAAMPEAIRAEA